MGSVVADCLVCGFVSCQTDHTTLPTEATGIPQSVLLILIGVVGSFLGVICLCIVGLLCFYFTRIRKEKLREEQGKTAEELNPTRVLHLKPPVIGSTVHDVSRVVELVKSKGDRTDAVAASERSYATLVDRPVLNPEVQSIDADYKETKVVYMANYQRRFTDVRGDGNAMELATYEPTSEEPVFGSQVDTL